jgi:membrane associated rhomboid family serine protease
VIPLRERTRAPVFAAATYAIAALNIAVFVRELRLPERARETFIDGYALVPYDLVHGLQPDGFPVPAIATLVTSQFLHGSVLHIFFNLLFFIVFAPEIELLLGHVRFVLFYLVCGVAGGLAQAWVSPASHVPSIGASGAIAGILGAFLVRYPTRHVETLVPIGCFPLLLELPAFVVIGLWAAVQFVHGFGPLSLRVLSERGGGTAYFAHIGGFLAGVILVGFFTRRGRAALRRRRSSYYSGW